MLKKSKFLICLLTLIVISNVIAFAGYNIEEIKLNSNYTLIGKYCEGLAVVKNNYVYGEKYGYIDTKGNVVIPCQYEYASDFNDGYAIIQKNTAYAKKWGVIDTKGNEFLWSETFEKIIGPVSEGKILVKNYERYTFIDIHGKKVSDFQYLNINSFSNGLALIENSGRVGYINSTTKQVIPFSYVDGKNFNEGLAPVKTNLTWQYIDKNNNVVIKGTYYEDATEFSEGIAAIAKQQLLGKRYAFINKNGEFLSGFDFEDVGKYAEGLMPVKQYSVWGFADCNGNIIIKPKYTKVGNFSGGYAIVCLNGKWGVIDTQGNEIIEIKYDEANEVENGIVSLKYYNTWKVFKISKKENANISKQKIYINGNLINFETYNILDNNYVKLRDVVYMIGKYNLKYNITWNEEKQRIDIIGNKNYVTEGNEMKILNSNKVTKTGIKNTSIIFVDEISRNILAYTIDGYNYMKLRDLGNVLNFEVEYNENTNSVNIKI